MKGKEKLMNFVKQSRFIYNCYYYVFSSVLKVLKLFVRPDDKLALFVSYGGRYFNDSPKCLYEAMQADSRFMGFCLVWAFRDPSKFPDIKNKVKIDTLSYFIKFICDF